jgi:hypothetical protein
MLLDVGGANFKLEALVDFVLLELAQLDVKAIDFRVELVDLGDAFAKLTQVARAEFARNGRRQICKVVGMLGRGVERRDGVARGELLRAGGSELHLNSR